MMNDLRRFVFLGTIGFFLLISPGNRSLAQVYTVKASVNKNRVLIGEQFFLVVEVTASTSEQSVLPLIDTIPHFEILEKTDPTVSGNTIRQSYRLTSFDSGHWVIPSFSIARQYLTDTIHMDVVFSDFDPNQDYHDIKDIMDVKPPTAADWIWWISIAAAVIILFVTWIVTRRKKPVKKPAPAPDAYKEAIKRINELARSNIPDRQFFSEVVDVFRLYVFRRKGILSLQKTTDDLVLQLKDTGMQPGNFPELMQGLRLADFVKFAKYQPSVQDRKFILDTVSSSIDSIEKTNFPFEGGG